MTKIKNLILGLSALVSVATVSPEAAACSCMEPNIAASFETSSDVVIARIKARRKFKRYLAYVVEVEYTFKGCSEVGETVVLLTSPSSAACGETGLRTGETYLINGDAMDDVRGYRALSIGLCDYNVTLDELTRRDRKFLSHAKEPCALGTCEEMADYDFGPCDNVLGVGIYEGECTEISGCEVPSGLELFEDFEQCAANCLIDID